MDPPNDAHPEPGQRCSGCAAFAGAVRRHCGLHQIWRTVLRRWMDDRCGGSTGACGAVANGATTAPGSTLCAVAVCSSLPSAVVRGHPRSQAVHGALMRAVGWAAEVRCAWHRSARAAKTPSWLDPKHVGPTAAAQQTTNSHERNFCDAFMPLTPQSNDPASCTHGSANYHPHGCFLVLQTRLSAPSGKCGWIATYAHAPRPPPWARRTRVAPSISHGLRPLRQCPAFALRIPEC